MKDSEIVIGKQYRVVGNIIRHGFDIGDVVRVYEKHINDYVCYNKQDWWWVNSDSLEEIQPNETK